MANFNLSKKYNINEINETLDKFVNIQRNNKIITSFDGRELCRVEVSNKYYNFDFSAFCKKIVGEIENYFTPDAYLLKIRSGGFQELRLVGSEVDINGETYLKMIGITNSTNTQWALSMNIGLVRKSNVTGSVYVSFHNKHYKKSMPNKIKNFADNLINFNINIEYHIKTIKDLAQKIVSFEDLIKVLSTNKDGNEIKSMALKVRALSKKLMEYGYPKYIITLTAKDIFDAYTELFKNYDTAVIGRETRRILGALDKCDKNRIKIICHSDIEKKVKEDYPDNMILSRSSISSISSTIRSLISKNTTFIVCLKKQDDINFLKEYTFHNSNPYEIITY